MNLLQSSGAQVLGNCQQPIHHQEMALHINEAAWDLIYTLVFTYCVHKEPLLSGS